MEAISDVTVGPCESSNFIKPRRIRFKQNGVEKIWDAMKVHDGVAIVVFNVTRNVFVFVKQFRPAVYINSVKTEMKDGVEVIDTAKYPGSIGLTLELCAGIVDKDEPLANIARTEVLEECGYDVPVQNVKKITTCRGGIGTTGSFIHLFYAEVSDAMKVGPGGGNASEGELIEVVEMGVEEGRALMFDESVNKVLSLPVGLYWFFDQIWGK